MATWRQKKEKHTELDFLRLEYSLLQMCFQCGTWNNLQVAQIVFQLVDNT